MEEQEQIAGRAMCENKSKLEAMEGQERIAGRKKREAKSLGSQILRPWKGRSGLQVENKTNLEAMEGQERIAGRKKVLGEE